MTENVSLTAYWMHDILQISEPITIDRHAWRLVQYREVGGGGHGETPTIVVDYEWREVDDVFVRWRQARKWPSYDADDVEHRGLPSSLRKLHEACPWAAPSRE